MATAWVAGRGRKEEVTGGPNGKNKLSPSKSKLQVSKKCSKYSFKG
jgi:hypothetical protein